MKTCEFLASRVSSIKELYTFVAENGIGTGKLYLPKSTSDAITLQYLLDVLSNKVQIILLKDAYDYIYKEKDFYVTNIKLK